MPDVIVSGGLRIPIGSQLDYEEYVRQELTFPNPFEPEEFLSVYVETATELIVPRGFPLIGYEAVPQVIDSSAVISVGTSYNLRDYQEPAVNAILSYFSERDYGQLLFTALCGSGKALRNSELVLTPHGFVRNDTICVGDSVIGSTGLPITVTGVYPQKGLQQVYRVHFRDKTHIDCNGEHLWTVSKRSGGKGYFTISTKEMYDNGVVYYRYDKRYGTTQKEYNYSVPKAKPCEFGESSGCTIHPYLLGLLLGDGCFRGGAVKITIAKSSNITIEQLSDLLPVNTKIGCVKDMPRFYEVSFIQKFSGVESDLKVYLKKLGLYNHLSIHKFIPDAYKYSALADRKLLIKGLIDSDGHVRNGSLQEYSTSSKQLSEDFLYVGRSIGMFLIVAERQSSYKDRLGNKVDCSTSYRINELMYTDKAITHIELVDMDYTTCISVDSSDNLYVTNNFTLTHNSFSLAGILSSLGMKTLVLSHLTMLNVQIFNELSENLVDTDIRLISSKDVGKDLPDIAIASFAALNSSRKLLELCANTYSLLVIDEGENAITSSRIAVILGLKFKYLIFMTATPTRELTQQTPAVKYFYGDKVVTMNQPEEIKIHSNHIMVDYRNLHWQSPVNPKMYKTQFGRFLLKSPILGDIVTLCHSIKTSGVPGCIWLVADLSVIKIKMKTLLEKAGLNVEIIDSATKTKERMRILKDITNGLTDVVIGSAPISAGLSIKELIVGIRLIPSSSSEETLEQSTGRLNRNCVFKKDFTPLWVDYVCSGSLEYNAKKRFQKYKGSTLGVSFVKPQELVKVSLSKIKGD